MTRVDLKSPEQLLRLGYGLVPIAAGADKFTNLLTHWEQYLDPSIARALPMKPATFMKLVGVIEMLLPECLQICAQEQLRHAAPILGVEVLAAKFQT